MYIASPQRVGGTYFGSLECGFCPCGVHPTAGGGRLHFQAFPDRDDLEGALHRRCGDCNTGPGKGGGVTNNTLSMPSSPELLQMLSQSSHPKASKKASHDGWVVSCSQPANSRRTLW